MSTLVLADWKFCPREKIKRVSLFFVLAGWLLDEKSFCVKLKTVIFTLR
ncbi:MAG: hypothetical protein LBU34_16445 [Planctomycetaceae bacterium]|jgi:hypothetical protein|nr:hypothetical protein [Planctomycetaceae bacterium]